MKNLTYYNNWHADEYYVGKTRVKTLELVKINEVEFNVITRQVSVPYTDHGHPGSAVSNHFFITGMVNGISMERDLNTLMGSKDAAVIPLIWS